MQSRFSSFWHRFTTFCIRSGLGRAGAKLWHTLMPSFPVKRRVFGLEIYFDSRDHPFAWYSPRNMLEEAENIPQTLGQFQGLFWDAGANAGLYSLWMAARGNPVVAFDISPKAISYVLKSAARNGLKNVTGVPRAFSVEPFKYRTPQSAGAGNRLGDASAGDEATAITYVEAAAQFGVPVCIKMDIEGHEEVFLKSAAFKEWVIKNRIAIVMELHSPQMWELLWKDVKHTQLSPNIVFIQPA